MLDSRVLETAIGLISLFFALSLITTSVQELIASVLKLRARTLKAGLKSMLVEGRSGLDFYNKLLDHPVIAPAGDSPSYISANQFSTAILNLLSGSGAIPVAVPSLRIVVQNLPDAPYKQVIASMFREGDTDLRAVEERLRSWFDQSMNRVSGVYKRTSQYISLTIGVVVAYLFQVNAIAIASDLWNEPSLRESVAANAGKLATAAGENHDAAAASLSQFQLAPIWIAPHAIGWSWVIGCAITAMAIGVGAPFWFDLLQKFVSLRGTGPIPAKATSTA